MAIEHRVAAAFSMDEAAWRRHANPLSVWTRYSVLPLMLAAIWSHAWLGWPAAIGLLAVTAAWGWLNPRAFPPPSSTDNWASRAVLGERIWLARKAVPIPAHHGRVIGVLSVIAAGGLVVSLGAAIALQFWPMMFGLAVVILAKSWILDRMVWIHHDMAGAAPGSAPAPG